MKQEEPYDVGVLVARFQVHRLHEAHKALIQHVIDHHGKVIIILGLAPTAGTKNNPLDYAARSQMIREAFPTVTTAFVKDIGDDRLWSRRLDQVIEQLLTPTQSAVIYGGRDSFIEHYSGKHPTRELVQESWVSGTAMRKEIQRSETIGTEDFRAGVIWATTNRYRTSFQTVDVAILDGDHKRVLLGKRDWEKGYRFIGGFVEAKSPSLEANVRREVHEEAGIAITDPWYIASMAVAEWRYRNEEDGMMTALFGAEYQSGKPTPGDDIDEVKWFDLDSLTSWDLVPEHHPLLAALQAALKAPQH